jgi:hypothetical protein
VLVLAQNMQRIVDRLPSGCASVWVSLEPVLLL